MTRYPQFDKSLRLATSILCLLLLQGAADLPDPDDPARVMVLGTWHFAGSDADLAAVEGVDVMTPRRQREIQDLIDRLEEFQPTMIALEAPPDYTELLDAYAAYRAGERELSANERQQIGFRLADRLDHDTLHLIDHPMSMDSTLTPEMVELIQTEYADFLPVLREKAQESVDAMEAFLAEHTVTETLRYYNSPEQQAASHDYYFRHLMRIGETGLAPGAESLSAWYKRNLLIVANLMNTGVESGDRVLVVFGGGHSYLLSQFLEESPYFEPVSPLEYLGAR